VIRSVIESRQNADRLFAGVRKNPQGSFAGIGWNKDGQAFDDL
jgi:hypothetical protein